MFSLLFQTNLKNFETIVLKIQRQSLIMMGEAWIYPYSVKSSKKTNKV